MARLYSIGIIAIILFLNIPEVRGDTENKLRFYRPLIEQQIKVRTDPYIPAALSLVDTLRNSPQTIINGKLINKTTDTPVDTTDTWSLRHKPSITAEQFDSILREYSSPAAGVGTHVTQYAYDNDIDSAYALYIFIHESTAGTNPNWNADTKNIGNIICAGYSDCIGRFRHYNTWSDGFDATIDNLVYYRDRLDIQTIDKAIETWAPPDENDTQGYINGLHTHVKKWREINNNAATIKAATVTPGKTHVVTDDMKVFASFDTVDCGSWGFQSGCQHYGTDIHVDPDQPVYTPVDCFYLTTGRYDDPSHLGDYVMCTTYDGYELYLGHLKGGKTFNAGEYLPAGTIVGYGNEAVVGPHTHVQLRDPNYTLVDFIPYYNERK